MSTPGLPDDAERIFREYLTAVVLHGQEVAAAMGMHPTDAYALNLLGVLGPLTTGELADRTGLSSGAATRLVDRLEQAGAVRRLRDPADRRRVMVAAQELDPVRRERADRVLKPARDAFAEVLAGFDAGEVATVFAYFARATAAIRAVAKPS